MADLHKGTLPLHLYAQVPLPRGAWVAHPPDASGESPDQRGNQHPNMNETRAINLEGMVARLRGYTGGSFTQMTHLVRPFREHVRASRARRAPSAPEHPQDLITTLAECDHDLEGADLTLAARGGGGTQGPVRRRHHPASCDVAPTS